MPATIIPGGLFSDARGTIKYVNDFTFKNVKRFYSITHTDCETVRAWQGHKKEIKHFFVIKGAFMLCWVEIDNWHNPSTQLPVHKQILRADEPMVLVVEAGCANGFRAIEPDSMILVFSNMSTSESNHDIVRFDRDYWKMD